MNYIFIQIFFFLLLFQLEFNEKTNNNQDKTFKKEQKSEIINLTDNNFNSFVVDGKYNRWLILFYIQSCYHCDRALYILDNILYKNQFKVINNIKFGKIDVSLNSKVHFRFNISQVPQYIIIENNTMIELDLYPNEQNLIEFIESNFSNSMRRFPLPKINFLKYYYLSFDNSISFFVNKINNFLTYYNINYTINPIIFILLYIILCVVFWTIIIKGYIKCCDSKKKVQSNDPIEKEEKYEKDIDKKKDEDKNDNKNSKERKNRFKNKKHKKK